MQTPLQEEPRSAEPSLDHCAFSGIYTIAFLALFIAIAVTLRTHAFFLFPHAMPVSNDEGYIAAMALRMAKGHFLPYVDGVSQRGPVLYWLTSLVLEVLGLFSWAALRVWGIILAMAIVAFTFTLAARVYSLLAAAVAVLVLTYFHTYELNPWDGIGVNGEPLAVVFALASAVTVVRMQCSSGAPNRVWAAILSGGLSALAGLTKQTFLIHALPTACWIALGPHREVRADARRMRELGCFALGMALPYAVVVAIYAAAGHLQTFAFYYQQYGRQIFMDPVTGPYLSEKLREQIDRYYLGFAAVAIAWIFTLALLLERTAVSKASDSKSTTLVEAVRHQAARWYLLVQCMSGFAGACFTFRFFPHYFVEVFPFASILIGGALTEALTRDGSIGSQRRLGAITLVSGTVCLLVIAHLAFARNVRDRRTTDRWYQDPSTDAIVRYVVAHSRPEETIFVWGFRAEIYISAHRYPASRYVYTVYPSGVVPWFPSTHDEEERRVVPGSREQLVEDLERAKPVLIVDAGRSMNGRYMYNYPTLRDYLDQQYCFVRYVDGEPVYVRCVGERCPRAEL